MPGPGAQSRKSITGKRLTEAIALGVGHSGVGQNLDQPFVILSGNATTLGSAMIRIEAEIADRRV